MTGDATDIEDLLRELAPQVLGALVRRYGDFDAAEDGVQEALLAALAQWPQAGVPGNPRGWLITVAARRMTDQWRSETARLRREMLAMHMQPRAELMAPAADEELESGDDDSLNLMIMCCHPALTPASQIALTLRAVGGLTTGEIARAFLVPESTMAQRISRAKATVRASHVPFQLPDGEERETRFRAVLHVLYLIFNEGYTASSGAELSRLDLTREAIRLTRQMQRLLPENGEVAGLLALMLLTEARRPSRLAENGALIPLNEQDRSGWDQSLIAEGTALIEMSLSTTPLGPYQLQAAIAALHDEAASAERTDWPQIASLYALLERVAPGPIVQLNRAVAIAMSGDLAGGLNLVNRIEVEGKIGETHRLQAVKAHLLEMQGDFAGAAASYRSAAEQTQSLPERMYLLARAGDVDSRLADPTTR